jgi:hypothetical protein
LSTPYIFSANTSQPQYENGVWDERDAIRVKIAAPTYGWYYPSDKGWGYGYIEGFASPRNQKVFEKVMERITQWTLTANTTTSESS